MACFLLIPKAMITAPELKLMKKLHVVTRIAFDFFKTLPYLQLF